MIKTNQPLAFICERLFDWGIDYGLESDNEIFDYIVTLDATDEQLDFPILCAIGTDIIAKYTLIETMHRKGFEFAVFRPEVLYHEVDGKVHKPFEEVVIYVHQDHSNRVIDNLQQLKGFMTYMIEKGENNRLTYKVP